MIVIHDRPPLWDKIDKAFNVAGKPVIFAWGDRIFDPMGVGVTRELHSHEEIHGERQIRYGAALLGVNCTLDAAVGTWWDKYIKEPSFRLAEEIPAHRAEYLSFCKRHRDRGACNKMLGHIASKLASPLYGGLISEAAARDAILRRDH